MARLTPAEREKWERRLIEAEDAYANLMTGQQVRVFVDQNGERIEYTALNANQLMRYITWIGVKLGTGRPAAPMGIRFS